MERRPSRHWRRPGKKSIRPRRSAAARAVASLIVRARPAKAPRALCRTVPTGTVLESQKSSKLGKLTRMRITSVSIAVSPASFQIACMAPRAEACTFGRSGGARTQILHRRRQGRWRKTVGKFPHVSGNDAAGPHHAHQFARGHPRIGNEDDNQRHGGGVETVVRKR